MKNGIEKEKKFMELQIRKGKVGDMKEWIKGILIALMVVFLTLSIYIGMVALENQDLMIKRQQILIQDHERSLEATNTIQTSLNVINDKVTNLEDKFVTGDYTTLQTHTSTYSKDVRTDLIIKDIADQLRDYPVYQQIRLVHNYLVLTVEYDYGFSAECYTTYGALVNGKAVCQGYAFAFYEIMEELGIESNVCIGSVDGVAHSWNFVIYNGRGYFVDLTFDDSGNTDEYFMTSEIRGHFLMFFLY